MSETTLPPDDAELAAIREKIIGNRKPFPQLARALNVTERSIYNLVARYHIPTVKFLGKQYADPAAIGVAAMRDHANAPPRRPGRPRAA